MSQLASGLSSADTVILRVYENLPNPTNTTLHARTEPRNEAYTNWMSSCIQFLCLKNIIAGNPKGVLLLLTPCILQEITIIIISH